GTALPGWPAAFPFPAAEKTYGPGIASIADVDGDGALDVVTGTGTCAFWGYPQQPSLRRCYTVYALHADGTTVAGFPKATAGEGATRTMQPAVADLDGDGRKEVVWIDIDGNVSVWTVPGQPGPERTAWPMYGHDARHTNALTP